MDPKVLRCDLFEMKRAFVDGIQNLLIGMRRVDEEPQSGRRFFDSRIKDWLHIDSGGIHPGRQL
jgi:hypothetical protein